ncbi:hypothetical protein AZE42_05973 [Rhizopogon vesiculosus]|uniref:Uncharacterized protein n=1 Tax=Rhizopogon vesiculosus TaxID=180088 RepID=A0A1J8PKB7_9AGAM|nr:hypothetical protein AZE42_05973 [Rhizopogon vesiculosus]
MSPEPDASSHILDAACLLLCQWRAPTSDAADAAVEKWERYAVKLLPGWRGTVTRWDCDRTIPFTVAVANDSAPPNPTRSTHSHFEFA